MKEVVVAAPMAVTVIRPIVSIIAHIVSVANDNMSVFYSENIPVICSAQADARCAELDATFGDTRTSVLKYTVTYEGQAGAYGNVYVYNKRQFVTQIEPLYPPVVWPPVEAV